MNLYINTIKLTDSPYNNSLKESFLIEDNTNIEQVISELKHAHPTSFLISGYRGVGKTSFINRIIELSSDDFIWTTINLSKYDGYPILLKRIIRQLYLQYKSTLSNSKTIIEDKSLTEDFDLLYDRTFNDIVNTEIANSKNEHNKTVSAEFDVKKITPYLLLIFSVSDIVFNFLATQIGGYLLFLISFVWVVLNNFKINFSRSNNKSSSKEQSRKSLYDDDIAEYHIFAILKRLKEANFKIVVAIDEIDKISTHAEVVTVINDLKPLLLSGYGNFFIISGQALYYEYEVSSFRDDQILTTLFSKSIHIGFLKYSALKKYCLNLLINENLKTNEKVNNFFDWLILLSGRTPRKLVNIIRSYIKWVDDQAYIDIAFLDEAELRKQAKLLAVIVNLTDNQLPSLAKNDVQLDFFVAQIHLWLIKMKEYIGVQFLMSDVINIDSYKDKYPDSYISQLQPLASMLIDKMQEENILRVKRARDDFAEDYLYWILEVVQSPEESLHITSNENVITSQENLRVEVNNTLIATSDSSFVLDFLALERLIRNIYSETISGAKTKGDVNTFSIKQIIEGLIDLGALKNTWRNSKQLNELIDTRNKIAHGQTIGKKDLDLIYRSTFTLNRLKSEIIQDYTFFIVQKHLKNYSFTKNVTNFDFIAFNELQSILFDVKHIYADNINTNSVNDIIEKYSVFNQINLKSNYYVMFIFRPHSRKSLEEFYITFNDTISSNYQQFSERLYLFYISEENDNGIENSVSESLLAMLSKISNEISFFDEHEMIDVHSKIKQRAQSKWPDNYEMQVYEINNQTTSFETLKRISREGLSQNIFAIISDKVKAEWPNDFEMQLSKFNDQKNAYNSLEQLATGEIPSNVFESILLNSKNAWPNDFEMQLYEAKKQLEAFKSLK